MDAYHELLDATISHLEELKQRGKRYISVEKETFSALSVPVRTQIPPVPSPRPASPVQRPNRSPAAPVSRTNPEVEKVAAAPIFISKDLGKVAAMQELRERAMVCKKCPNLAETRKNVVFGVGNVDAELVFVGEAPGAEEDIQGEPFVGKAGQLLTKIIQTMGLSREQVYIANILKCRPDTPGQSYGNRPPTTDEMDRCLPYLHAQIDIIQPKVLVALGGTAMDGLFGKIPGVGITKMRGKWREYRGIPVMATYHPSYLLRPNPSNVKRECWEDMMEVMERLNMPISEKQRGYFLAKA